jgi:hypothetical protein
MRWVFGERTWVCKKTLFQFMNCCNISFTMLAKIWRMWCPSRTKKALLQPILPTPLAQTADRRVSPSVANRWNGSSIQSNATQSRTIQSNQNPVSLRPLCLRWNYYGNSMYACMTHMSRTVISFKRGRVKTQFYPG